MENAQTLLSLVLCDKKLKIWFVNKTFEDVKLGLEKHWTFFSIFRHIMDQTTKRLMDNEKNHYL